MHRIVTRIARKDLRYAPLGVDWSPVGRRGHVRVCHHVKDKTRWTIKLGQLGSKSALDCFGNGARVVRDERDNQIGHSSRLGEPRTVHRMKTRHCDARRVANVMQPSRGDDRVGVSCEKPRGDIGRSSRYAKDMRPALGHSNGQTLARECSSSVDQVRVHRYLA